MLKWSYGPSRWDGNEADWPEWSFDMTQWARKVDITVPGLMQEAAVKATVGLP